MSTLTMILLLAAVPMLVLLVLGRRHRQRVLAERRRTTLPMLRVRTPAVIKKLSADRQEEVVEKLVDLWRAVLPALEHDERDRTRFSKLLDQFETVLNDGKSLELASREQRRDRLLEILGLYTELQLAHLDELEAATAEADRLSGAEAEVKSERRSVLAATN